MVHTVHQLLKKKGKEKNCFKNKIIWGKDDIDYVSITNRIG